MATNNSKWIAKPLVSTQRVHTPEWFIHGMLPENCLAVLYGDPGSFKTFEIIAVAMCLATGLPFCGRQTKQTNVLYIAADPDPDTPKERGQAWTKHYASVLNEHGITDFSNVVMFDKAINLHNQSEVEAAHNAIKAQNLKPGVIFFDTLFHSSIGADLMKPEQMLPIIERARWLTTQVGARTGFIAHHTPKHGKTLFGTQALLATVDVVWRSDKINEYTAKLTCERIKRARIFPPITLTFHSMELQMTPNSFGDEWVEQLVLNLNVQHASKAKTKEEQDLEDMEYQLETFLGNKATSAAWFDHMAKWTSRNAQSGWSRSTFDRKLKKLKDDNRVSGGGQQGELYSVTHHPNTTAKPSPPSLKPPSVKPQSTVTAKDCDGGDGGFEDRQAHANHRQNENDGGSSISGNEQDDQVVTNGAEAAANRAKELLGRLKRKPNAA
jgi:hypothetical protein